MPTPVARPDQAPVELAPVERAPVERAPVERAPAEPAHPAPVRATPAPLLLVAATLLLFLVWSNSFVAMTWLLGTERSAARLDWLSLTSTRFLPVTLCCAAWLLLRRRAEALTAWRAHGLRAVVCGLLAVPLYSFALFWGISRGVPAPIASLLTALSPLFLLLLGAAFLGEPLTRRKAAGFVVSLAGLGLIAAAREGGSAGAALAPLLVAALAPLGWAVHTALSKPVMRTCSPAVWTALYLVLGGLPLLAALPWLGGAAALRLDASGWAAVLYLALFCTLLGFLLWTWLLQHLPASSVGLTVFLNPPLTLGSKALLTWAFPGTFLFAVEPLEIAGGAVVLGGLGVALARRRA